MGIFDKFISKEKSVLEEAPAQSTEKNEYNPKLGDPNRYENARHNNKEFSEKINREALSIVNTAMPILEKLEKNPNMKNFHDPITEGKWMGQYLQEKRQEILDLYGVSGVSDLEEPHTAGVPREIRHFLTRAYQSS